MFASLPHSPKGLCGRSNLKKKGNPKQTHIIDLTIEYAVSAIAGVANPARCARPPPVGGKTKNRHAEVCPAPNGTRLFYRDPGEVPRAASTGDLLGGSSRIVPGHPEPDPNLIHNRGQFIFHP